MNNELQEILDKKVIDWESSIGSNTIALPSPWLPNNPQYEEEPVDIRTFIESPDYQNANEECWPVIKEDLSELFTNYNKPKEGWKYNEAVFDEGMGGGKSYKASEIIEYMLYLTLCQKNPQESLGLAKDSGIYFMNMSVRADQAKKVVFGEIVARVNNSNWFRARGYLPNPDIKSELQFPKNINVIPGNSKETFPLGFNLLGAVMDEAAWYTETDSHDTAEEIYNALYGRIFKRFGNKGMIVMISSPRYVDDFIEKKMKEAETNPKIFSRRRSTWEAMKGSRKYSELYPSGKFFIAEGFSIPIEDKALYSRNPDIYRRNFMAIPSLALEPYFKQWDLVEATVSPSLYNPVDSFNQFQSWFTGKPLLQYYMHIDLSLTTDSTGIAMVHREGEYIIADLLLKIRPQEGKEIDLAGIQAIVLNLKQRGFDIFKCTYDSFQSASSIQELNKKGVNSEKLSVDKDLAPYETLKEAIYTGKLKIYNCPDLFAEMSRLELVDGRKVEHPARGEGKDLSDALAGAVYNCVSNQNMFSFGFAGDVLKHKTQEDLLNEAQTLAVDGLVPYGYYRGRR